MVDKAYRTEESNMWDYAMLTKTAKTCGGPLGLVTIIAASGIVLGSAGTIAVQKLARANRAAIDGPDGDEPAEEIER